MIDRTAIVAEARAWLGTPYHHHGRVKGVGVDCAQLLCAVYEALGIVDHVETGFYPIEWHLHHSDELFLAWLDKYAHRVDVPQPGDVTVWRYGRCYSHGSICAGDTFIHSYLHIGVIESRATEEPLQGRPSINWSFA
jgi:cell wall-associated NlpC family hydrolase